jgi:DNA polymerase III alpha subunit
MWPKYGKDMWRNRSPSGVSNRQFIRDVGRALELPYPEVDKIAKLVPDVLK